MPLFLAFLIIPLIEIGLFIKIGGFLGLWPTLGIVILTAVLGAALVRNQGFLALSQMRGSLERLEDPTEPLAHGAMILLSGALLLTPGFFTDAIGFGLLIPGLRHWLFSQIKKRVQFQTFDMDSQTSKSRQSPVILEGEYEDISNKPRKSENPSGWTKH